MASLETRQDLVDWACELLPDPYACPHDVGSSFRYDIRAFEWASRPFWAVFSLMAGGMSADDARISAYIDYLRDGLTPDSSVAFVDPTVETRQIVFEQVVYGYGLLCLGDKLLDLLGPHQQERLVEWLNVANSIELPWGIWYLGRIMVNIGLKQCGLAYNADRLASDAHAVKNMYSGDGWYEDSTPFQRDSYIGSAFHFVILLIDRFALEGEDAIAVERAEDFAEQYRYWFDVKGRSLPFGRSLTYRFGNACFWAAYAPMCRDEALAAEAKAILFSNLNWWRDRLGASSFSLGPGYGYLGAPVSEDYTSPGASFWAFRSFTVLTLAEDDPFWTLEPLRREMPAVKDEPVPGMIMCAGKKHSYALSAMQYCSATLIGRFSKYGKLCYSTAFGWNASKDVTGIGNFAVDNALAISIAGTDQYASRGKIQGYRVEKGYAYSMWSIGSAVRIESWLVPIDELRHLRIHHIESNCPITTYEGGFPVFGWSRKFDVSEVGEHNAKIYRDPSAPQGLADGCGQVSEIIDISGCEEETRRALEAVGLLSLLIEYGREWTPRVPVVIRQNPVSNIYSCEQNGVPALKSTAETDSLHFGCIVYGDPGGF
jgi:hypothetical protein